MKAFSGDAVPVAVPAEATARLALRVGEVACGEAVSSLVGGSAGSERVEYCVAVKN